MTGLSVAIIAGLSWSTVLLLGAGDDGIRIATVLVLPVTAVGIIIAALGLWSRPSVEDPSVLTANARRLLNWVVETEGRALNRLLGDSGDARPADTDFLPAETAQLRWRADGHSDTEPADTVAAYYRSLDRGRMAVLGAPGAGKTVLASRLLLDLAVFVHAEATAENATPTARIQVPVRLSLSTFPVIEDNTAIEVVREKLDTWLTEYVGAVVGRAAASALVTDGWIVPVLDGLDEMDADDAEPVRARTLLTALNLPAGPARWPVVLTCRTDLYRDLVAAHTSTGVALQDATTVELQPLNVAQVVAWLRHRFPDAGQADGVQRRWRPVINRIRQHPTGRLAHCLASPLRLHLAVSAYLEPTTTPGTLAKLAAADLDDHLFARFVPSTTANHPRPDGSLYVAEDVERWLTTLANHLAWMGGHGFSGVDFYLHQLWRTTGDLTLELPGIAVLRRNAMVLTVLAAIPVVSTDISISRSLIPISLGLAIFIWFFSIIPSVRRPQQWRSSLAPDHSDRRTDSPKLAGFVAILLVALLGYTLKLLLKGNLTVQEAVVTGGLLLTGAAIIMASKFSTHQYCATRPTQQIRKSVTHDVVLSLLVGIGIGIGYGFLYGHDSLSRLESSVLIGVPAAIAFRFASSPWIRYLSAVLTLSEKKQLPGRPARFLDWACDAGLIRQSGIALQFRHQYLQTKLTTYSADATVD